jgi:hypothetical protein
MCKPRKLLAAAARGHHRPAAAVFQVQQFRIVAAFLVKVKSERWFAGLRSIQHSRRAGSTEWTGITEEHPGSSRIMGRVALLKVPLPE